MSEIDRLDDEEKLVNAHIECFQEESTLMKKEAVLITEIEKAMMSQGDEDNSDRGKGSDMVNYIGQTE